MTISHHDAQDRIQDVILDLVEIFGGTVDQALIRDELGRRLLDAGIGEQPAKWIDDTATEIAHGRTVVMGTRSKVGVDTDSGVVTPPEQRTSYDI